MKKNVFSLWSKITLNFAAISLMLHKKVYNKENNSAEDTIINRINSYRYRWGGKGASNNPCSEIYRGSKAFSEPESKALSVSNLYIS